MRLKLTAQYVTDDDGDPVEIDIILGGVSSEDELEAVQEFLRRIKWGLEELKKACPPKLHFKPVRTIEEPIEFDGQC